MPTLSVLGEQPITRKLVIDAYSNFQLSNDSRL